MMESPVLHLESTVPITACEMAPVLDLLAARVLLVVSALFKLLSPSSATSYELLSTNDLLQAITATARKNITGDKLSACAKVNGSVSAPFHPDYISGA